MGENISDFAELNLASVDFFLMPTNLELTVLVEVIFDGADLIEALLIGFVAVA